MAERARPEIQPCGYEVLVEMRRDPARWFCSGLDASGVPRIFGRGDTEKEASDNAHAAADLYIRAKNGIRTMPIAEWRFVVSEPARLVKKPMSGYRRKSKS
jgi:hypothetical protein